MRPCHFLCTTVPILLCACAATARPVFSPVQGESAPAGRHTAAANAAAPRAPFGGDRAPKEGDRRIYVGVGDLDSPEAWMLGADMDLWQSKRVAIGPSLQLGLDDNVTVFAPSFHAKFAFPLDRSGDSPQFMPFLQGGAGFAYISKDTSRGSNSDFGFMLQAGGGLEVRLDDNYALASTLMVNLLPSETVGERAYVSWQFIQFSFKF